MSIALATVPCSLAKGPLQSASGRTAIDETLSERSARTISIAVGPERTGPAAWRDQNVRWLEALSTDYSVSPFRSEVPASDVVVWVGDRPGRAWWDRFGQKENGGNRSGFRLIYAEPDPVPSVAAIDRDWWFLRQCDRVIVGSPQWHKYFQSYAKVETLDFGASTSDQLRSVVADVLQEDRILRWPDPAVRLGRNSTGARPSSRSAPLHQPAAITNRDHSIPLDADCPHHRQRVAVLSFLFNWPSTAGGIVHTTELVHFLSEAGYHAQHFYIKYDPWQIGRVDGSCPIQGESIEFSQSEWTADTIREKVKTAIDRFSPDVVLITDSWNMKPHLAAAVQDYPYFLRMQANECLCPLNNLRLYADAGRLVQCDQIQLDSHEQCHGCTVRRGEQSGPLHRLERELAGVGTNEYDALLRHTLRQAEAVLVLNPEIGRLYEPHANRVEVVTWGMDPHRFPPPYAPTERDSSPYRILFAGLTDEPIKGFTVLLDACRRLWQQRTDFRLAVTADPVETSDEFIEFLSWQSQTDLPAVYRSADLVAVPSLAQEGLSRTAVEAMASARPVIGSRIGGMPFVVEDGVTGRLVEPGDADALRQVIGELLDEPQSRQNMGAAGRQRFEERFTWPGVIEREYRRLFSQVRPKTPIHQVGASPM